MIELWDMSNERVSVSPHGLAMREKMAEIRGAYDGGIPFCTILDGSCMDPVLLDWEWTQYTLFPYDPQKILEITGVPIVFSVYSFSRNAMTNNQAAVVTGRFQHRGNNFLRLETTKATKHPKVFYANEAEIIYRGEIKPEGRTIDFRRGDGRILIEKWIPNVCNIDRKVMTGKIPPSLLTEPNPYILGDQ